MPVELYKRGPKITNAEIDAFESRLQGAIPVDYRKFLLAYNGGRPEHHVIRNAETGDLGVKQFFGIWKKEYYDIDAENRSMAGRWPNRLLAFAIDGFGNFFCLSLESPDCGTVYFWDHEQESEENEEPTELNLYHLADSFTEFWELIEQIDRDAYLAEKGFGSDSAAQDTPSNSQPPHETNGEPT